MLYDLRRDVFCGDSSSLARQFGSREAERRAIQLVVAFQS